MMQGTTGVANDKTRCRVCGETNTQRFAAHGFESARCPRCLGIHKCLTRDEYLALSPTYDPGNYLDTKNRSEVESFLNIDEKTPLLVDVAQRYLPKEGASVSFLDVGCGIGGYLLAARARGFEPSRDHSRVATEILKLPLVGDYFSPQALQGRSFDLVMLSHVIGHIYQPRELIHMLVDVLKPGGVLVIITPKRTRTSRGLPAATG